MTYSTPQLALVGQTSRVVLGLSPGSQQDHPCNEVTIGLDVCTSLEAEW
jgi:hypothetical protein